MVSSYRQRSLPTRKNSSSKSSATSSGRRTLQNTVVTRSNTSTTMKDDKNKIESKEKRDLVMAPIINNLLSLKLKHPHHRLPHSELKNIVEIYQPHFQWLTLSLLKGRLRRKYAKFKHNQTTTIAPSPTSPTTPEDITTTPTRPVGGRPTGSTSSSSNHLTKCLDAARSEITLLYQKAVSESKKNGCVRTKPGTYKKIHEKVKVSRNLPTTFNFPYNSAKHRLLRHTKVDNVGVTVGHQSPLRDVENDVVDFIIQLGKIGSPVTCSQAIYLINDLIDGTVHQRRLIEWKKKQGIQQSPENFGRIGTAYWYAFLSRHHDRIRTKKGRKFELDRSKWTKYRNFSRMYDDVEEELVNAGLAVSLENPTWMDAKGNEVEEKKAVGMKVSTKLTRPEMCIVMDEVGCNINMTKDGHVNGTKFVVDKNDEAKQKASKKEKHFTCLGLTLLSGAALMCVVIIDGKSDDLLTRTGVEVESSLYDDSVLEGEDEHDRLLKNMGPGKQYPCGPTCSYEGKDIPCMVEFNPGGGINATILTNIFRTLDKLNIFSREEGIRPFVLLDGHSTRFDIEFLEYINDSDHRWSVCIGVPYGTSLWQVGDSVYQNGQFKVRITVKKEKILDVRSMKQMGLEILTTDIIPIVNYGWSGTFDNVQTNIKAILR
jgi:hypothetical protein